MKNILKNEKELLNSIIKDIEEYIFIKNNELIYIYVNDSYCKFLSLTKEEIIGKSDCDLFPKDEADFFQNLDQDVLKSKKPITVDEFATGAKTKIWVSVTKYPIFNDEGNIIGIKAIGKDITKRKYYEISLKESELKLQTFIEHSQNWEYWIEPNGTIRFMSLACEKITGFPVNEFLLETELITKIIHPEDRKKYNTHFHISHNIEVDKEHEFEFRIITKDNKVLYINHYCIPIYEKNGSFIGRKVVNRNITKSKEMELMLKESEKRYKLLADNIVDNIWTRDLNLNYTYISPSIFKITGYTFEEEMNRAIHECYTKESLELINKVFQEELILETLETSNPDRYRTLELAAYKKDGSIVWIETKVNFFRDSENRAIGILGVTREISLRKKIEDNLKALSQAVEQSPASIVITDINGNIQYVNHSFIKLTGYGYDEIMGQNPRILKSGFLSNEFYENLWNTILSGKVWFGEFHNIKKNGEFIWELASISPIRDNLGKIISFVAVKEDITDRKKIEEQKSKLIEDLSQTQLLLKEAISEKDKFFSIIAHDLKNPFVALLHNSEYLLKEYVAIDDSQRIMLIKDLFNASKSTYRLLQNLLEWARSQMGRIKYNPIEQDLYELAFNNKFYFNALLKDKEIELEITTKKNQISLIDSQMIDTVFRNLISNAIKFSFKKSKINISINEYKENKNFFLIKIKDSGIGMSEEIISKLFILSETVTRPGTEKEMGSGLGLLLCKDFIKINKGEFWVESKENAGTTFYFTLPIAKK